MKTRRIRDFVEFESARRKNRERETVLEKERREVASDVKMYVPTISAFAYVFFMRPDEEGERVSSHFDTTCSL